MSDLHVRFKAYDSSGAFQGFLQPSSWSASVQHNDAGTLSMTYPRVALNGGILQRGLEQGLEIGMEVATHDGTWVEPYNCRFLLVSRSRDAKDSTDTVTLNCMTWIWLTKKILNLNMSALLTDTDNKGKRPFYAATSGMIVHTLLDENRTRGGAATVMSAGFNSARDTNGDTWAYKMTLYYDAGIDLYTVIDNLSANGMCDWRTDGRMLKLWNADSTALCRDLSARVRIPLATGLLESPEEETIEGLAGNILIKGDNLVFTQENPAAPTPWGKWELYSSQGGVSNKDTARLMMQTQLASAARVRGQYTRQILTDDIDHVPLVDYRPGDWVTAPTVTHGEKVRVQRIELSNRNDGGVKCALMLNDRLYDAQTRQAKRIQGITGGAVAGGASGATPAPEKDHRVPKAPTGLVVQTDAYLDANGYARGLATAHWAAVTQATNSTSIEITSYRVEWRPNTAGETWRSAGVTTDTTMSWGNLDCGTTILVRVRAVPTYSDRLGEWSDPVPADVARDATPPSVPSVPVLASETGIVTIHWDGKTASGALMETDFDHVEVGRGTGANNITMIAATQSGAGDYLDTTLSDGDTRYYALRAVDHAGNRSQWSTPAQVTCHGAVSSEDLEQINQTITANKEILDQAKKELAGVKTDVATAKNDIATNQNALETANRELSTVKTDIATAKQAADTAQATADSKSTVYTQPDEPAHDDLTPGDVWRRTSTKAPETRWLGEANNSVSVLVTHADEVEETLVWNGTRFTPYYLFLDSLAVTGSISTDLLAANAVTAEKIKALAITTDKLAANAVNADKIAANAVTADKIKAGSVVADKLTANAVTTEKIAALAVNADKIAANAITSEKISALAITADKIAAGTITSDKIKAGQFVGYVFTGAVFQSHTEDSKGFKLRDGALDMWNSNGDKTVHLDGDGQKNLLVGELRTALTGDRIVISPKFSASAVGSDRYWTGSGISFPLSGTYAVAPYIATESNDSLYGPVSTITIQGGMRTDGSAGAGTGFGSFMRLGQTRNESTKTEMATVYMTANCDYLRKSTDTSRREWRSSFELSQTSGDGSKAELTARKPNAWAQLLVRADDKQNNGATWIQMSASVDGKKPVGIQADSQAGILHLGGYLGGLDGRATFVASWSENSTNTLKEYSSVTHLFGVTPPAYGRYKSMVSLDSDKPGCYWSATTCNEKSGSFRVIVRTMPRHVMVNATQYAVLFNESAAVRYNLVTLSYLISS